MTGFNLFNANTTAPTAPTANFGASSTVNTPNSFFGSNTAGFGAQTPAQNTTFGSGTATGNISFGLPKTQNNVTFGASPSTNATGGFGSTQPTPSFGASATQSNLTFGTPNTQSSVSFKASPGQTNVGFGTPSTQAQSTFGALGTPSTQAQSSFGALPSFGSLKPQTPTTTNTLFGATATSQPGGLLGSTPPTSNTNVVKPTLSTFGGGLNFPASTSAGQIGSAFGSKPVSTGLSSSPATQSGLFSMPTATSITSTATVPPTVSFGLGSTSQTTSFGVSAPLSSTTASVQPTTAQGGLGGISFGATGATTTSTPSLSFGGLGATTAATSSATTTPGLLGSSFGATTTASTSGVFSWQKPASEATAASTSIGLGGVDHTAVSTAQSTANTVVSAEEQPLPNEIQQTVASFKEYVKTQKTLSSEVARTSAEPLTKLTQQIGALNNLILTLGSILSQQKFTAERIKLETIKSLNDYELAQKIKDSPVASEERMLAIRKYFTEKISAFEEGTKTLQEKIEYVYQHVTTLPQENSLSAEALKLIVKKLHDSFVVIGARAYKLHNDMQLLKVQYLTLRNQYVKDNSSISFSLNRELQLPFSDPRSKSNTADFTLEGPNPFSKTAGGSFNSLLLTSQNRNFPQATTPSKDWGISSFNTPKPFGFADTPGSSFDHNSSYANASGSQQFNLQKPPVGNKRGKR